jgi:hypothetical protein
MDQFAQSAFVAAIGDCAIKGTLDAAADGANPEAIGIELSIGRKHALAADGADFAADGMNFRKASGADGKPGNVQQGFAANAAVRGKENGEEAFGGAGGPDSGGRRSFKLRSRLFKIGGRKVRILGIGGLGNNTRPCYFNAGLARPGSVLTTAEDGLLVLPLAKCCQGPIRTTFAV